MYSFLDITKGYGCWWGRRLIWVCLYLLSLAGLPPLVGCGLKVLFLFECWGVCPLGCVVLIVCSGISLVFYLSCFISVTVKVGIMAMMVNNMEEPVDVFGMVSLVFNLFMGFPVFFMVVDWV